MESEYDNPQKTYGRRYYQNNKAKCQWISKLRYHMRRGNVEEWLMENYGLIPSQVPELATIHISPDQILPPKKKRVTAVERIEKVVDISTEEFISPRLEALIVQLGEDTARWYEGIRRNILRGIGTDTLPEADRDRFWSLMTRLAFQKRKLRVVKQEDNAVYGRAKS